MINLEHDETILSYDELTFVINTVIESTDIEITRIKEEKELQLILEELFKLYHNTNYFTFFVLKRLTELTSEIFDNAVFRDFLFNLVDRVSISLPFNDTDEKRLTETVARGICRNKTDSEQSLVIKEIKDSVYVNKATLISCLENNFWLVIVYLLSIHFHKTTAYQEAVKNTT